MRGMYNTYINVPLHVHVYFHNIFDLSTRSNIKCNDEFIRYFVFNL